MTVMKIIYGSSVVAGFIVLMALAMMQTINGPINQNTAMIDQMVAIQSSYTVEK